MALKIVWTSDAQISRRAIFDYWNERNKSRIYSNKLNIQFNESLKQIALLNEIGKQTDLENIRIKIVSHFVLIYEISNHKITILDIWDTRQNPLDFPINKI